ncbi:lysylphosphatidylglycerol synthase domain-containing protein [Carboxylicivirga linearis]|uniref:Flippase-like domain-containing protein n=1 Tax=Carboxylicivirga linearis TaxID=1628157 RepID=A0ABS5JXH5_9BACT|nr:lysylphosphatidylglycerol synthase domain-containing protein [Carboxylicivirga linearis]MBS2099529.1 flippase-like domain-containing protein [Carboxylicivirga linearis]
MKPKWPYLRLGKRLIFILVSFGAYYFIVKRLTEFQHWNELLQFSKPDRETLFLFILFLLLWFGNILTETKKWQILIRPFLNVPFKEALIQFFAGSYTAVGSPARLAEPGGRMVLMKKGQRLNALMMTSIGGFIQNIVIGVFGVLSLYFIDFKLNWKITNSHWLIWIMAFFLISTILVIILLSFKNKWSQWLNQLRKVNIRIVFKSVLYTIIRFIIYNIQLIVLMRIFYSSVDISQLFLLTPIYFFIITIVPSFILADIGIRGSAAFLVFYNLGISEPVLLTVILLLWFFNVVIPALIGGAILHIKKGLMGSIS